MGENRIERIKGLDGLRAIAVLLVIVVHLRNFNLGSDNLLLSLPIYRLGNSGVDLFFVISGFVITWLLLVERRASGTIHLPHFWWRRFLRILPPFTAYAMVVYLLGKLGVIPWSAESFLAAVSFTQNLGIFQSEWFYGHVWSLSVEEQFYLLWPLIFLLFGTGRRTLWLLLACALSAPLIWYLMRVLEASPIFGFLAHLDKLAAGCLLAILIWFEPEKSANLASHRYAAPALIVGLALSICYLVLLDLGRWPWFTFAPGKLLYTLTLASLVGFTAMRDSVFRRTLELRPIVYLGTISYSLYLWQQLFLADRSWYFQDAFVFAWPFNVIAMLVCAMFSYHLIERPIKKLRKRSAALKT